MAWEQVVAQDGGNRLVKVLLWMDRVYKGRENRQQAESLRIGAGSAAVEEPA